MGIEYLSGIGNFDQEEAAIITEERKKLSIYDCKLVLLLNDLNINGENLEGKCIYIPINDEDTRFQNDYRFRHREYLVNALKNYTFGDGNNIIHNLLQEYENGDDENTEYETFLDALNEMGICVYSNLEYGEKQQFKNGALYIPKKPKTVKESQIEQIRNMIPALRADFFVTGIFIMKKVNTDYLPDLLESCFPNDLVDYILRYYGKKPENDENIIDKDEDSRM